MCASLRGISLPYVVGKVAKVLQERLKKVVENELYESQCGFKKGSNCTNMIFTVREI